MFPLLAVLGCTDDPSMASGHYFTCVAAPSVECWGNGEAPTVARARLLSAYLDEVCAVSADSLDCWGFPIEGGGLSEDVPTLEPSQIAELDVGLDVACARSLTNEVECWGPSAPQGGPDVGAGVAAGDGWACVLTTSGALDCWGSGPVVEASDGPFELMAGNPTAVCASSGTAVTCFGGVIPDHELSAEPSALTVGGGHACAVVGEERSVECWGLDDDGQAAPPGLDDVHAISAGALHTCAIDTRETLACWGSDTYGQSSPPD